MLRVVLTGILSLTLAMAAGGPLEAVLARMDRVAATLKDLSADLTKTHHTAVINEDTEDSGTMFIKRPKPQESLMRVEITQPEPRQYAMDAHKAEVYSPKSNVVQVYEIGQYKKLADQLLLLGFGTTSKELAGAYSIALGGPESVDGQPSTRLELTPKSSETHLMRVDLWISDTTGLPVQEKLYWPGGDYDLLTYSKMKINPNLPDSAFKPVFPRGVKREYPQK
jgi:outer membrane lipoprotein-sorting protein